jgi:hypothetical protein
MGYQYSSKPMYHEILSIQQTKKKIIVFYVFYKNREKSDYIIERGRSKMLDSG